MWDAISWLERQQQFPPKNLVRQLVSLSDLSADKPAGSFRRLFGIRQHDAQCCSALAACRRANRAANNYGIKAAAREPNKMMWCFTLHQLHITVWTAGTNICARLMIPGGECVSLTSSSFTSFLSSNHAIFGPAGASGDSEDEHSHALFLCWGREVVLRSHGKKGVSGRGGVAAFGGISMPEVSAAAAGSRIKEARTPSADDTSCLAGRNFNRLLRPPRIHTGEDVCQHCVPRKHKSIHVSISLSGFTNHLDSLWENSVKCGMSCCFKNSIPTFIGQLVTFWRGQKTSAHALKAPEVFAWAGFYAAGKAGKKNIKIWMCKNRKREATPQWGKCNECTVADNWYSAAL